MDGQMVTLSSFSPFNNLKNPDTWLCTGHVHQKEGTRKATTNQIHGRVANESLADVTVLFVAVIQYALSMCGPSLVLLVSRSSSFYDVLVDRNLSTSIVVSSRYTILSKGAYIISMVVNISILGQHIFCTSPQMNRLALRDMFQRDRGSALWDSWLDVQGSMALVLQQQRSPLFFLIVTG
jgi:hypothetical protein